MMDNFVNIININLIEITQYLSRVHLSELPSQTSLYCGFNQNKSFTFIYQRNTFPFIIQYDKVIKTEMIVDIVFSFNKKCCL